MNPLEQLCEQVRAAAAHKTPLRIRGSGSKDFYGERSEGAILDTRAHAGITTYEPTELYATARCGTPLRELEQALAENGQMLAFEPPHFGADATIGGMVAAGLSGPRRAQMGALRDFVLGVQIIDGQGQLLRFGGSVMKNVAGYDISRLMAGSLGTLGLITEVTLKVLPSPIAELTLRFELPQETAITRLNEWAGLPLPISASVWHEEVLTVRLSGAVAGIATAREKLGGEPVPDVEAREFWHELREHAHPFFGAGSLWRFALPSTTPPLNLPGRQLVEWHGGLRWLAGSADAARVRAAATSAGGHATLFRGGPGAGVFHPLPAPLMELHRRVKQTFDPQGIFNLGRMYAGL